MDKSNTYSGFISNISFLIQGRRFSFNKSRNITTQTVVSYLSTCPLIFITLSDLPKSTIFPYIYMYIISNIQLVSDDYGCGLFVYRL